MIVFARHFFGGVFRHRIPPCCSARWSFLYAARGPQFAQAARRGLRRGRPRQYVPCGVFHRPEYRVGELGPYR